MAVKRSLLFSAFALGIATGSVQCQNTQKISSAEETFVTVVTERLGKKYTCDDNQSRSFALCKQTREGDQAMREFNYVLIRRADNKVTHEGIFRMGDVRWKDDTTIEVTGTSSVRTEVLERKTFSIYSDQH
jgi:hypothetical protein